jgi:hypothetical protein
MTGASLSAHFAAVVARYETLRAATLGAALPPEVRSGLVVLLHQGLWRWARALVAGTARPTPVPGLAGGANSAPFDRRAVIYVLAAMAMTINDRRTPCRRTP